jgi:hypothetical protein
MQLCILGFTYIMKRICSTVNTFSYQAVHSKTERSFTVFRKLCTFQDEIYYNGTNSSCVEVFWINIKSAKQNLAVDNQFMLKMKWRN